MTSRARIAAVAAIEQQAASRASASCAPCERESYPQICPQDHAMTTLELDLDESPPGAPRLSTPECLASAGQTT